MKKSTSKKIGIGNSPRHKFGNLSINDDNTNQDLVLSLKAKKSINFGLN